MLTATPSVKIEPSNVQPSFALRGRLRKIVETTDARAATSRSYLAFCALYLSVTLIRLTSLARLTSLDLYASHASSESHADFFTAGIRFGSMECAPLSGFEKPTPPCFFSSLSHLSRSSRAAMALLFLRRLRAILVRTLMSSRTCFRSTFRIGESAIRRPWCCFSRFGRFAANGAEGANPAARS